MPGADVRSMGITSAIAKHGTIDANTGRKIHECRERLKYIREMGCGWMRLIDADALIDTFKEQQKIKWNQCSSPASWSDAYDDFIDSLQMSETVNKWISVKDRLPEKMPDEYLVVNNGAVGLAIYHDGLWISPSRSANITHWMPLPEPPEEVTQDD